MLGEQLLFARQDGVEESWRVLERVLGEHAPVIPYVRHTWGPDEQDCLIADEHHWHDPVPELGGPVRSHPREDGAEPR